MGNIVLLDDLTINKIAAGEVIERPASVVKEMVENSIDAGAKNITIEIKNGGISLIKITDDGHGIAEDDMEIAFERHATSKIRSADDLQTVTSMGFRGEALASIASIARVEMVSKKDGEALAHKIVVEGGKTLEFTESARSVGTTITVQNLFYNTPVRYKFLKKDYTEAGYIEDAITRIALVNKNVAIKLISNGKTIIQTNGSGELSKVIYSIYGKDISREIIEVDYEYEDIKVTGAIGKPVIARGNRANQLFFLNNRYIKDKNLSAAADQAYKGMISVGRFGFIVLNLQMDPKLVDVNVHPAKLEVRFEDESKVFKAIYHAIKANLAKSELAQNVGYKEYDENVFKTSDLGKENENRYNIEKEEPNNHTEIIDNNAKNVLPDNTNLEEKIEVSDKSKGTQEKKKVFSGLFQKIKNDEKDDFLDNNPLEDIFRYRQSLQNNNNSTNSIIEKNSEDLIKEKKRNDSVNEILDSNDNYQNTIQENKNVTASVPKEHLDNSKIVNNNIINKKVNFGNTLISSDTQELYFNLENSIKNNLNSSKSVKNKINNSNYLERTPNGYNFEKENLSDANTIISSNNKIDNISKNINEMSQRTFINENIFTENASSLNNNILTNITEKKWNAVSESTAPININVDNENITSSDISMKDNLKALNENTLSESTAPININLDNENVTSSDISMKDNLKALNENTLSESTAPININLDNKNVTSSNMGAENLDIINRSILNENTQMVDNSEIAENINNTEIDDNAKNENITTTNTINDEMSDFSTVAEKIVEEKLQLDNTQILNTKKVRDEIRKNVNIVENSPEFDEMYKKTFGVDTFSVRKEKELQNIEKEKINALNAFSYPNENLSVFTDKEEIPQVSYKFLGIAFSTYIIIELKNEMYIIDQHAAHERIMYEKIKNNYYSNEIHDEQFLLLPDVITLTHKEMIIARENVSMFKKAGFTFEEFGDNTIKLVSVPGMCEILNTKELFLEILDELDTVAVTARQEKEDKFIATIACKCAVKAKMKLNAQEVECLIDELLKLQNPFTCPHGRPTAIKMTKYDLERKFSRR